MADVLRSPLLDHDPAESPVFLPGNLLEAARVIKGLPKTGVPSGCLLDFDGELVEHIVATGRAAAEPAWPCFHTRLFRWKTAEAEYGVIGGTIGAPYAVLVAEELFASGCEALVGISSVGLIAKDHSPPFFLKEVVCLAHITNAMSTRGEDFEKGGNAGLEESLAVCALALEAAVLHAAEKKEP